MTLDALVVYKRSTYEFYASSPDADVRAYVRSDDPHAALIRRSHETHRRSLDAVLKALESRGWSYDTIWRADLEKVNGARLIISVGGDGTFLDASHYVRAAPILGVNSDPSTSVGHYCCTDADGFGAALDASGAAARQRYARLELSIDGRRLDELALNDILFAHPSPAAFTRYDFSAGAGYERIGSSGLLVCAAGGSTGWMRNVGGAAMEPGDARMQYHHRDAGEGRPAFADAVSVISRTREGRVYIDGEHTSYDLRLGQELRITPGAPLTVIGSPRGREQYTASAGSSNHP